MMMISVDDDVTDLSRRRISARIIHTLTHRCSPSVVTVGSVNCARWSSMPSTSTWNVTRSLARNWRANTNSCSKSVKMFKVASNVDPTSTNNGHFKHFNLTLWMRSFSLLPFAGQLIFYKTFTWCWLFLSMFTAWHVLFSLVLIFSGLRIEAPPHPQYRVSVYTFFWMKNQ